MKKILFLILFFCAVTLSAQQKIAVVDMQKVFSGYDKTKTLELQMNEQVKVYQEYAAKLLQEYRTIESECKRLRDDSMNLTLSEAERESRKRSFLSKTEDLKRKEQEITEYNRSRQKLLKEQFDKKRAEVIAEIRQVVSNKCMLEGWTMALDKSGVTLNDLPIVIYNVSSIDITQAVLDDLNRAYRTGKKEKSK